MLIVENEERRIATKPQIAFGYLKIEKSFNLDDKCWEQKKNLFYF